jgi:hypothetical protein
MKRECIEGGGESREVKKNLAKEKDENQKRKGQGRERERER